MFACQDDAGGRLPLRANGPFRLRSSGFELGGVLWPEVLRFRQSAGNSDCEARPARRWPPAMLQADDRSGSRHATARPTFAPITPPGTLRPLTAPNVTVWLNAAAERQRLGRVSPSYSTMENWGSVLRCDRSQNHLSLVMRASSERHHRSFWPLLASEIRAAEASKLYVSAYARNSWIVDRPLQRLDDMPFALSSYRGGQLRSRTAAEGFELPI
jgi:hypothetical protein